MAFVDAFERAINDLKLCPNRVWAVCGKDLPKLLPIDDNVPSHKDHDQCTYEHCEWSQRDFTAVEQRHECASKESCAPLHGFFSEEVLKQYPEKGGSTVWSLEGRILLQLPRPYMAISHVWSDGTGTGSWPAGQVNPCLYLFFRKLAYQFQCEGIWWDTLCIPRDKELRSKVIRNMHQMYRHARVTLVHDIFLREWTWVDAEHACFAILMSPWFSRGWTALELAESRKVKVIFGGEDGPLIKDLDEEILAKDGSSDRHKEASKLIENLRRGITDLNSLLAVLGPRYTSWPKDVAIIAGLLLDIDIAPRQNQKDVWAQDIYKRALLHMGTLYPGHLFHNTATISNGNSWCPISLVNMPKACGGYTLNIEKNMDITGTWNYIPISKQNVLMERCVWRNMHPFMQEKIKRCLDDPKDCILLAELSAKSDDVSPRPAPSNQIQIQRAILVRKVYNGPPLPLLPLHLYIGALDFQPAIVARDVNSQGECLEKEIKIQGEAYSNESEIRIDNSDTSISQAITQADEQSTPALTVCSGWSELHLEVWTRPHNADNNAWDGDINCQDERGQQALHLAAERGTVDHVSRLLEHPDIDPCEDINGQTALHRAAWGGSLTIVKMLLDKDKDLNKLNIVDHNGNAALHIASAKGFADIVKALVQKTNSLHYNVEQRFTPLHFAAYYGHISVAQALIEEDAETYLNARDNVIGWTPLHFAALAGQKGLCEWLIDKQPAFVDAKDDKIKWTPIYCAIAGDHRAVFELLATKSAHTTAADSAGFTPQQFGDFLNHHKNADSTQEKGEGKISLPTIEVEAPLLYFIATCGQHAIAQALFNSAHEANWPSVLWKGKSISNNIINAKDGSGMTILHLSTGRGFLGLVQQLVDEGCNIGETDDNYTTPLLQATVRGEEEVVQLLLKKGADVEACNQDYNTGLLFSAERGFDRMVRLFLDNGANIENGGEYRQTALSRAAERGHDTVVRILLEEGANKNSLDCCGQTPLSWAAEQGHETVVRLLLEAGAETNTLDDYNQTPLSLAEERGYTEICKLLQPDVVLNRI